MVYYPLENRQTPHWGPLLPYSLHVLKWAKQLLRSQHSNCKRQVGMAGELSLASIWTYSIKMPLVWGAKESACQHKRCRLDPWSREIPHASKQLSRGTATTEPLSHHFRSPHTRTYTLRLLTAMRSPRTSVKSGPLPSTTRETPEQHWRPGRAKNNILINFLKRRSKVLKVRKIA